MSWLRGCIYAALLAQSLLRGYTPEAQIQPEAAQTNTRMGQMEQEQRQKAASLGPQKIDKPERVYKRVINNPLIKRLLGDQSGFGIQLGTLYPGSGFALGPDYSVKGLMNETMDVDLAAIGSLKQYYELRATASFRHLANDRAILDVDVRRMDAPQVRYYGAGNDSDQDKESDFRLEGNLVEARLAVVPFRRVLRVGIATGYSLINVGPGQSGDVPSADVLFGPEEAPGIDRQTDFLRVGPFVEADWRDRPGDPHRGGSVGFAYNWNLDRDARRYSFRRMQIYVEQYFPFLNEKRVIALRGRTDLSYTSPGQSVPFYAQPTLGGPNDLRGYPRFRYYDNNSIILNAEYRRELGLPIDFVVFTDWGKVFSRPGHLGFGEMHGSGGVGLRFKSRSDLVMRIDVGFSPEGVRFWWVFSDLFRGFLRNLY